MATAKDPLQPVNPEPQSGADSDKLPAPLAALIDELDVARTGEAREERNGSNGSHTPHDTELGNGDDGDLGALIKIRGRPGGVAIEIGAGEWELVVKGLQERLHAGDSFFRGGRVVLEVGDRLLVEDQLHQVCRLLEAHAMTLSVVRATAERTLQAVTEIGVGTSLEELDPPPVLPENPATKVASVPRREPVSDHQAEATPPAYAPDLYAPLDPAAPRPIHFVHRGSLRSGQVLRKTESIVVIGDVNPGAQVISGGDIMVWGRLRGVAHAGADGNRRSVVTAIDFVPTQLRIANLTAIAPDKKKGRGLMFWKKEPTRRPEIARVVDGRIVVEPWDEFKPKGLGTWRK